MQGGGDLAEGFLLIEAEQQGGAVFFGEAVERGLKMRGDGFPGLMDWIENGGIHEGDLCFARGARAIRVSGHRRRQTGRPDRARRSGMDA